MGKEKGSQLEVHFWVAGVTVAFQFFGIQLGVIALVVILGGVLSVFGIG